MYFISYILYIWYILYILYILYIPLSVLRPFTSHRRPCVHPKAEEEAKATAALIGKAQQQSASARSDINKVAVVKNREEQYKEVMLQGEIDKDGFRSEVPPTPQHENTFRRNKNYNNKIYGGKYIFPKIRSSKSQRLF